MRQWQLQEPKTPQFKNPQKITTLAFTDRLNTKYCVQEQDIEEFDLGENPTYKDYIVQGLDPNVGNNKQLYGIAKSHKPLTTRISEMRQAINQANGHLKEYLVERDKVLSEANQPQPTKEEAPKNDK